MKTIRIFRGYTCFHATCQMLCLNFVDLQLQDASAKCNCKSQSKVQYNIKYCNEYCLHLNILSRSQDIIRFCFNVGAMNLFCFKFHCYQLFLKPQTMYGTMYIVCLGLEFMRNSGKPLYAQAWRANHVPAIFGLGLLLI